MAAAVGKGVRRAREGVAGLGAPLRQWSALMLRELRNDARSSWRTRMAMLRRGFLGDRARRYDFDRWPPSAYVSDLDVMRLRACTRGVRIGTTLTLPALLSGTSGRAPARIALLDRGRVVPLDGVGRGDVGALTGQLLEARRDFVIKPVVGAGAAGMLRGRFEPSGSLTLDGGAVDASGLEGLLATLPFHLVEERVGQHEGLGALHSTVNPVRVLVLRDDDGPFIAAATLRLGTARSEPGVAFSRGGLSVAIDVADGRMGSALQGGPQGTVHAVETHPDGGARIEGRAVPRWAQLKEWVLAMVEPLRFIPAATWDVAITPDDFVVLAVSPDPSLVIEQQHAPLGAEPRVRAFFDQLARLGAGPTPGG